MKEKVENILGIGLFYILIILMIFIINARFNYLNGNNNVSTGALAFNN